MESPFTGHIPDKSRCALNGSVLSTETHDWYKNYTVASSSKGHLQDQDRYPLRLRGVPLIEVTDTKFKQWSFYPGYFDGSRKGVS